MRRLSLFLFAITVAVIAYFSILYINSPQYKFIKKFKQKANSDKINVFFSYTMISQSGGGIPFVGYDIYSNLQKRDDINLYSQGSEKVYRKKHILYYVICQILRYKEVSSEVIQNIDIFFSLHPDDFTIKTFKQSKLTKKSIKYYTIIHDVHMAIQYMNEVKDISKQKTEQDRISLLRADKIDNVYRFFDLDKMDGIFVISNTSIKDIELFFPETKNIPKYLMHWPVSTRIINDELYYNNKKIFGDKKLQLQQDKKINEFIKNNKLYILTSISKNFVPVYEAVKKINQKHPELGLKIAFTSHRGGMPAMYGISHFIELDKNFKCDPRDCFETGLLTSENMEKLMKNTNLYVSNNFYEGYGLDTIDAMENGIPIIVNDVGSNREVIGNGGYIAKNKKDCKLLPYFSAPFISKGICEQDENDLQYAIEKVLLDENFRKDMIKRGKEEMKKKDLSWSKLVTLLISTWKKDLNKN